MRSSSPAAETRMPVSTGRVSSRDAERATLATVSTNAVPGTLDAALALGLRERREVLEAQRADVERRGAARRSRRPARPGAARARPRRRAARGRRRRAGAPAGRPRPRATTSPSSGTRRPISMSVARSSIAPPLASTLDAGQRLHGAAGRGRAGDGLQLGEEGVASRRELHRVALALNPRVDDQGQVTVIRGCESVHSSRDGRTLRGSTVRRPVHEPSKSVRRGGVIPAAGARA